MPDLLSFLKLIAPLLLLSAALVGLYIFFNYGDNRNRKLLKVMKLLAFASVLLFILILIIKMISPSLR